MRARNPLLALVVLTAGAAAGSAVWLGGATYGPGTYYDSVVYLSAADSLRHAGELLMHDGTPLVTWPPGFPAAIAAAGGGLHLDIIDAARLVNALAVALLVALSGWSIHRLTRAVVPTVLGAAFLATSASSLEISSFVLSEPVFAVLIVVLALTLARHVDGGGWWWLLAAGATTAAAIAVRYVGVAMVPAAVLVVLCGRPSGWRQRAARTAVYTVVALGPLAPLVVRNLAVSDTITGPRAAARFGLLDSIRFAVQGVATWLVPTGEIRVFDLGVAVPAALVVVALTAVALVVWWRRWRAAPTSTSSLPFVSVALVTSGVGFLVVSAALTKVDPYFQRQLLPYLAPVVVTVAAGAWAAWPILPRERWRAVTVGLVGAGLVVLLALDALASLHVVRDNRRAGVGGLTTRRELAVPFRHLVAQALPEAGPTVSNGSELVYLDTGRRVAYTPPLDELEALVEEDPVHVVYYDYGRYLDRGPSLEDLREAFRVTQVAGAEGGAVIRLEERTTAPS